MSEQPPELVRALEETPTGATWQARRADGALVLAVKLATHDEAVRGAALERLRRLAHISDPHLAPPRGWWQDGEGVWYVLDGEQGEPFTDLPTAGFLSPQQASVISLAVLEGIQALHGEGLLHGALSEASVRVLPDGQVRLTGHHLARLESAPPGQGELAAELRRAGAIVCAAFGIPVQRNPFEAPRAVEHAAPALVSTARTIASGGTGADAALAISSFRDTAGPLARPERQEIGRDELATLVSARRSGADPSKEIRFKGLAAPIAGHTSAAVPVAAVATAAPAAARPAPAPVAPRPTWSERQAAARPLPHEYEVPRRGRGALIAGAVIAVLVIAALGFFGVRSLFGSPAGGGSPIASGSSPAPQTSPPPKANASPVPAPVPTFAPAAAGSINGVDLKLSSSGCAPGESCFFALNFHIASAPGHTIQWTFKLFDRCTYATTDGPSRSMTTQDGWTLAQPGDAQVAVPNSKGQVAVVAVVTNNGDTAASPAVLVGPATSCA